jgi:hypothetical protein
VPLPGCISSRLPGALPASRNRHRHRTRPRCIKVGAVAVRSDLRASSQTRAEMVHESDCRLRRRGHRRAITERVSSQRRLRPKSKRRQLPLARPWPHGHAFPLRVRVCHRATFEITNPPRVSHAIILPLRLHMLASWLRYLVPSTTLLRFFFGLPSHSNILFVQVIRNWTLSLFSICRLFVALHFFKRLDRNSFSEH